MCGIAGIVGRGFEFENHPINKMASQLIHRGPDATGYYIQDDIALGHTRLSVIDLSENANQPFLTQDQRYTIVYNGEIYNYRELRTKIPEYEFRSNSDTEVVLAAYFKWGVDCLSRFNGMFAFAIWDSYDKTLFVARDRMGIKPLYYCHNDHFIFGSEIRSLISSGLIPKKTSYQSISEFLTYQTVHAPHTIVDKVFQLRAGNYGIVKNNTFEEHRYWSPTDNFKPNHKSIIDIQSDIKQLLFKSVEKRMISDVPLGAFLSGGIDSSAIVGVMSSLSDQAINTFSIGFDEKQFDESQYSSLIAKSFNTQHQQLKLSAQNLLDQLPNALAALDSPSGDFVNSYIVAQETKRHGLTVALSGLGGDELFAGYPVFRQYCKTQNAAFWFLNHSMRKFIAPLIASFATPHKKNRIKEMVSLKTPELNNLYPIFRKIHTENTLKSIIKVKSSSGSPIGAILSKIDDINKFPPLSQLSIAEIETYSQNVLLRDADRMGMAHALEVRVPFFDHELVEYMLNIPDKFKEPVQSKRLLIDSLGGMLPKEITNRNKQGFTFPWEKWMKTELESFCDQQILALENFEVFNTQIIQNNWMKFKAGDKETHWSQIWLLVVLSHWMNKNIN